MKPYGSVASFSLVLWLVVCITPSHTEEIGVSQLDVSVCLLDEVAVLAQTPILRVLVHNPGGEGAFFFLRTATNERSLSSSSIPSSEPDQPEEIYTYGVPAGKTVLITRRIGGMPGVPIGKYEWETAVCSVPSESSLLTGGKQLLHRDSCAEWNGKEWLFRGEFEFVEPTGFDRAYFERYLQDWYWSGDRAELVNAATRAQLTKGYSEEDLSELRKVDFEDLRSQPWFDIEMNNRYFATNFAQSHPVQDIDETMDLLVALLDAEHQLKERKLPPRITHAVDQLRFLSEISETVWLNYVVSLVYASAGTEAESAAVDEIRTIAENSPDCAARWLAGELVRRCEKPH